MPNLGRLRVGAGLRQRSQRVSVVGVEAHFAAEDRHSLAAVEPAPSANMVTISLCTASSIPAALGHMRPALRRRPPGCIRQTPAAAGSVVDRKSGSGSVLPTGSAPGEQRSGAPGMLCRE